MPTDLSVTLVATLLFLLLSSKYAASMVKQAASLSDDMSVVLRAVLFALLIMGSLRLL
jgi:hypothetical protein